MQSTTTCGASPMKETTDFPPNYNQILISIPKVADGKPIFCYGDTIHNPYKIHLTPDLIVHEEKHKEQQGIAPEVWWEKYLASVEFRFQQELEAYGTQYAFMKPHVHGKLREWLLDKLAEALSGELYGGIITFAEARSKIRNYAHH